MFINFKEIKKGFDAYYMKLISNDVKYCPTNKPTTRTIFIIKPQRFNKRFNISRLVAHLKRILIAQKERSSLRCLI